MAQIRHRGFRNGYVARRIGTADTDCADDLVAAQDWDATRIFLGLAIDRRETSLILPQLSMKQANLR